MNWSVLQTICISNNSRTTLRFKIDTLIMFTTLRQYLTTYHAGVHACTVSICSTRVTYVISNHVDA